MRAALSSTFALALLASAASYGSAHAQAAPDAVGHWEGLVTSPIAVQSIAVDIGRNPDRSLKGALTTSDVAGLPLATISQSGDLVRFALPPALATSFEGHLDPAGQVITGTFVTPMGEAGVSFTRDGEAEFAKPIANGRIEPKLEGVWEGAIDAAGRHMRVRVALANGPNGASGVLSSLDEGLDLPLAIEGDGARLKLAAPMVEGVFDGALNAAGDTLAGSYSQHGLTIAMVLTRAKN